MLRAAMPDLNIRGEVGMPDRLTRLLTESIVQCALVYTPQIRPGLVALSLARLFQIEIRGGLFRPFCLGGQHGCFRQQQRRPDTGRCYGYALK